MLCGKWGYCLCHQGLCQLGVSLVIAGKLPLAAVSVCVCCRDSHGSCCLSCSEVLSVWLVDSSAGGGVVFLLVLVPGCFGSAGHDSLLEGHRNVSDCEVRVKSSQEHGSS